MAAQRGAAQEGRGDCPAQRPRQRDSPDALTASADRSTQLGRPLARVRSPCRVTARTVKPTRTNDLLDSTSRLQGRLLNGHPTCTSREAPASFPSSDRSRRASSPHTLRGSWPPTAELTSRWLRRVLHTLTRRCVEARGSVTTHRPGPSTGIHVCTRPGTDPALPPGRGPAQSPGAGRTQQGRLSGRAVGGGRRAARGGAGPHAAWAVILTISSAPCILFLRVIVRGTKGHEYAGASRTHFRHFCTR